MLNGKIDKSVPIPLYFQLKEIIIGEIKNGNYEKDAIIPTEKEFIEHYQISRTTVRQAITELVQEGWLYRVKSMVCIPSSRQLKKYKIFVLPGVY